MEGVKNFHAGFTQKYHSTVVLANSLDPDQEQHNVGPDLDPNCLTL